jgi:DNA replicative helicase MCM subunit Mcm2 (Cdc46/Mcm family)
MSVQVVLQANLVNSVKPGDRVQIIGIYKLIAGMATKEKGLFRPYFICLSIKPLNMVYTSSKRTVKLDFPK